MTATKRNTGRRIKVALGPTVVDTGDPICNVTECGTVAVNVIKQFDLDGQPVLVKRCQDHTSKWDHVLPGPGPAQ